MSERRVLYLPVETKARELLGKTFLAARAVERGWIVVVGEGNHVREFMKDRPRGAYIEIGIPEKKIQRLKSIRASGHSIANLCEEGLVYSNGVDYCNRKLGPSVVPFIERLLVVGDRNASDIRSHRPQLAERVAVTGNPRFDTLLAHLRCIYAPEASAIRERFGRFVLVNTNFTRANPHPSAGQNHVQKLNQSGMIGGEAHAGFFQRFIDYQERLMQGMQRFLQELASAGAVDRIVVRPHPVENHEMWRAWAKPLNIEVHYEGSAVEWMLAAEALLHPGCTTAIEGLMLDRPVFSYVPEPDSEFLNPSDLVSERVSGPDEFLQRLAEIRQANETDLHNRMEPQREKLRGFVANVDRPYSADRILNELEALDLPTVKSQDALLRQRGLISRLRKWRRREALVPSERKLQKFPSTEAGEIEAAIGQWVRAGVLQQSPAVEILGERLWAIHEA